MPYQIKPVSNPVKSFKVCKIDPANECFSKQGLPYKRALAQMRAIIISEKGLGNNQKRSSKKVSKKASKKASKKISKKLKPIKPSNVK